jgi:hypothetical protein
VDEKIIGGGDAISISYRSTPIGLMGRRCASDADVTSRATQQNACRHEH